MTAPSSIDPTRFLHEQLGSASPDLLRQMLTTFMNTLMSAEADAVCGAPTARPRLSGSMCATATGTATSTLAPAPSMSRSPSCAKAAIFRLSRHRCGSSRGFLVG